MLGFLAHQLEFVSGLGKDPFIILFFIFLVVLYLMRQNHFKTAFVAVLTSVSLFYSLYLKQLFQHTRPLNSLEKHYFSFDIYSFPSTHVLFYTTFWGFIFYLNYK